MTKILTCSIIRLEIKKGYKKMKAYKATVKKSKRAIKTQEWTFFAESIEGATDYAERMTEETYHGEGEVVSVAETKDPRSS